MRDYKELVKSLRICADSADPISECCFSDCCEHDEPIDPLCMGQLIHMAADAIEEIMYIAKAKNDGKILILNDRTALAIAAGARSIRGNKRLAGATYVYDVFGKDGGPYEINYNDAREILTTIWNAYPLPEPPKEDDQNE